MAEESVIVQQEITAIKEKSLDINEEIRAIRQETEAIKKILAIVVGAADRSVEEAFSEAVMEKVAKDFLKLSIERGDWVKDEDIRKYVPSVPYNAGNWLRKEFGFCNCYRHGHHYYYSKKDLIAFNEALQKRNIDLTRYREMLESKRAFDNSLAKRVQSNTTNTARATKLPGGRNTSHTISTAYETNATNANAVNKTQRRKSKKPFQLPDGITNITTSPTPKPDAELVRADLQQLKESFKANNYAEYVDVYKGVHAMMKRDYSFYRYRENTLIRGAIKRCENFNYANAALKEITGKKEKFVPPPDINAIEL